MRGTEEQMQEILKRADKVKETRIIRKHLVLDGVLAAVFLVLLVTVLHFLPKLSDTVTETAGIRYGSLLLTSPYMGVVLAAAAVAAFVFCTVRLCIGWRYLKKKG